MRVPSRISIVSPMVAVSLLLLFVGVSGAWYVHLMQKRISNLLDINVSSIRAAEELELEVRDIRANLNQFLLSDDQRHLEQAVALRGNVYRWLDEAVRLSTTEMEKTLTAKIQHGIGELFQRLVLISEQGPSEIDTQEIQTLVKEHLTEDIIANARKYLDLNENQLEISNEQNRTLTGRVVLALLLLGTCGSIAGLVLGYGVARGIRRSILQLSVPIRDVAGKLNEVVGPVSVSADPGFEDLETVMKKVSSEVSAVIEQLERTHHEVMRADQLAAVGQLAAGLAHELRNPLMAMKVLVQSARQGGAAKMTDRDIEVLDEEIARLENLLQTFLDFARPAQLQKQTVDLREMVRQTIHLLSRRAERQKVALVEDLGSEPCPIEADLTQIRQVVLNLLLNALDAVPRGGTVWINIQDRDPAADSWVVLEIADDGQGLPEEDKQRIFEPFFSTKETGLGLGLAICKRILEVHGGEISAGDRPQGGAIFTIRLPSRTAVDPARPMPPLDPAPAATTSRSL